jgi:hypothetical protein
MGQREQVAGRDAESHCGNGGGPAALQPPGQNKMQTEFRLGQTASERKDAGDGELAPDNAADPPRQRIVFIAAHLDEVQGLPFSIPAEAQILCMEF